MMKNKSQSAMKFEDNGINVKVKLSFFWITLMFFYIYADILGFYSPGIIENVITGELAGIQLSEGYLLVMAVWMAIPSLMIILSATLKASINRWVNLIVGLLSLVILGATFFVGEFSIRYTFQALIEAVLIIMIVWSAWKWPQSKS